LGQEPQQAKKPPAFRNGKQVVCAIWVPSGIACNVTIYRKLIAFSELESKIKGKFQKISKNFKRKRKTTGLF